MMELRPHAFLQPLEHDAVLKRIGVNLDALCLHVPDGADGAIQLSGAGESEKRPP